MMDNASPGQATLSKLLQDIIVVTHPSIYTHPPHIPPTVHTSPFIAILSLPLNSFFLLRPGAQPSFLPADRVGNVNLWMSVGGSRYNTHYDHFHNLLCAVAGGRQGTKPQWHNSRHTSRQKKKNPKTQKPKVNPPKTPKKPKN